MKQENVQILYGKVGVIVKIDYYDKLDSRNHSIEDDEIVHPDLRAALMAFQEELSVSYYAISSKVIDKFIPNEFSVTEKDGAFFLTLKGKFETSYDDSVNVTSGKILMGEDSTDDLVVKLNTLRSELFQYFWNDKNAQGKLPFKEGEEVQEENTILKD